MFDLAEFLNLSRLGAELSVLGIELPMTLRCAEGSVALSSVVPAGLPEDDNSFFVAVEGGHFKVAVETLEALKLSILTVRKPVEAMIITIEGCAVRFASVPQGSGECIIAPIVDSAGTKGLKMMRDEVRAIYELYRKEK